MNLKFKNSFKKDLKKIKNTSILSKLKNLILELEKVNKLEDFSGDLKKLKGGEGFWRIRLGDYRIGIIVKSNTIIFVRILHRKEIYKYFP